MTPKLKHFESLFQYVLILYGLVKIDYLKVVCRLWAKKSAFSGCPNHLYCSYWADGIQNMLNNVAPRFVHVYQIWSGVVAVCRSYSQKIDFSDFQSTLDPRYNAVIWHHRPYRVIVRTTLYWNECSVYMKQRCFLSRGHTISCQFI